MGDFIYFTEEQKERANAVHIADILRREHEEVERSGNEWRWKRHRSVTFRGSSWYRHSRQVGSHAIDFMQEFFGMSYPEAVSYLLDGEQGQLIERGKRQFQFLWLFRFFSFLCLFFFYRLPSFIASCRFSSCLLPFSPFNNLSLFSVQQTGD